MTEIPAPRDDWQTEAACIGLPPEWWFPAPFQHALTQKALRICWQCPVRTDCLEYALKTRQSEGIWGGCTDKERDRIVRRRRKRLCPECGLPLGPHEKACLTCGVPGMRKPVGVELDGVNHGTRHAYNDGCRCEDCRRAEREYSSGKKRERRTSIGGEP